MPLRDSGFSLFALTCAECSYEYEALSRVESCPSCGLACPSVRGVLTLYILEDPEPEAGGAGEA